MDKNLANKLRKSLLVEPKDKLDYQDKKVMLMAMVH